MGLLLIIITWFLTPIFEIINFITTIFTRVKDYQYWKTINFYFKQGAIDRDRFANYNYQVSLNFWLSKGGYKFGNKKETMSSVLGKKQLEKSLNIFGWFWIYFLYIIDFTAWKKGGHCIHAIQNNL